MAKRNKLHKIDCPFEAALDVIGGKWKGMILFQLLKETKRFNELKKLISNISQKMLTQQLRELENDGLVIRKVYAEIPAKVEYSLTKVGKSLKLSFQHLQKWEEQFTKPML